jgi:hypothetical protein
MRKGSMAPCASTGRPQSAKSSMCPVTISQLRCCLYTGRSGSMSNSNAVLRFVSISSFSGASADSRNDQTAKLEEIFRVKYGFTTKTIVLDCHRKKPENQLHLETAKFIDEHDGHHRTNLIIVYYSGHGFKQKEDGVPRLWLSGYVQRNASQAT